MSLLQAIILGIIQGLTEFLPISSSAHLVLTRFYLGWNIPQEELFPFDVLVQVGTLLAVIVYFWKDLLSIAGAFLAGIRQRAPFAEPQSRMGWYLILASIPAGVIGLLIKPFIETLLSNPVTTSFELLLTAGLLFAAERIGRRERSLETLNSRDSWVMGFAQALAILPGVSRSGATMAGGMARQLTRPAAARFSFLMSIPVMLAAGLLALVDLFEIPDLASFAPSMAIGFLTSAVVGYLSIRWLLAYLTRHSLRGFATYCTVLALGTLFVVYVV